MPTIAGLRAALTPVGFLDRAEARRRGITRHELLVARSWHLDLLPTLVFVRNGLVLDIGAHTGQWTRDLLELVPSASVIAVEPQADLRRQVERRFAGDSRVTVDGRAVGEANGERELHLLGASVNASLYPPRPDMDELYARGWQLEDVTTVETTSVDSLVDGREVALMKVDVQGAEREVLAGARETLPRTAAAILEVTFVSHYDGDATFAELHAQMVDAGFLLTGISDPARSPAGVMLTCDAAYVQRDLLDPYFETRPSTASS